MKSRDLRPNIDPDMSVNPNVLHTTAKSRRSSRDKWIWILVLILAFLYAISPIDFIPDVIPVLGWIDDVVVTITAVIIALPKILKR